MALVMCIDLLGWLTSMICSGRHLAAATATPLLARLLAGWLLEAGWLIILTGPYTTPDRQHYYSTSGP
jgi:hypothetical protein